MENFLETIAQRVEKIDTFKYILTHLLLKCISIY